jgi:hypothetical protein
MAARKAKPDSHVSLILDTLARTYLPAHRQAVIDAYRYNPACVRVRIIDPDFAGQDWLEREEPFRKTLWALPEETFSQISLLLLLTSEEAESSDANREFENPTWAQAVSKRLTQIPSAERRQAVSPDRKQRPAS